MWSGAATPGRTGDGRSLLQTDLIDLDVSFGGAQAQHMSLIADQHVMRASSWHSGSYWCFFFFLQQRFLWRTPLKGRTLRNWAFFALEWRSHSEGVGCLSCKEMALITNPIIPWAWSQTVQTIPSPISLLKRHFFENDAFHARDRKVCIMSY